MKTVNAKPQSVDPRSPATKHGDRVSKTGTAEIRGRLHAGTAKSRVSIRWPA